MTHQRQVVFEEILKMKSHPTADEIYERVRKRLPKISMGTVYRNLEILASSGLINKIEPGHSQMRFEGNVRDHYHITCIRCGKIEDAEIEPLDDTLLNLENALGRLTKHGIFAHKLEFIGLCKACRAKEGDFIEPGEDD
ncbi:MAG: transcriptional repressor [Deltaproteobacteria bacterium]|nr:transcriptional repressor [Deltaproteobacteria bacterium]